jgi:hypothetical protein
MDRNSNPTPSSKRSSTMPATELRAQLMSPGALGTTNHEHRAGRDLDEALGDASERQTS